VYLERRGLERRGLERRGLERKGLERKGLERKGLERKACLTRVVFFVYGYKVLVFHVIPAKVGIQSLR